MTADPANPAFYRRPVAEVAPDMVGAILHHGGCSGRIVETEAYHESEPACHAYAGLTARTSVLFGAPGTAYVYRSYGIHALLNAVCEEEEVGAAVLIRALEPLTGLGAMRARRGLDRPEDLCSGPGKLTQAMGIGLELNDTRLGERIELLAPPVGTPAPCIAVGERVGITRAVELPWRFCDADSHCVSRPPPPGMARSRSRAA